MLRPRFAINVYAIGGVVFLVVGAGMVAGSGIVPEGRFVLLPTGAFFVLIGLIWTVLAGRRGRLRDPRGLAGTGTRCTARLADVRATSSTTRSGEYGPIISQVFRLDLEIAAPWGPYTARVFRSLRGQQIARAVAGTEVPVAVDQDRPRRIAILWDEVQGYGGPVGWPVGAVFQGGIPQGAAVHAPTAAGRITAVSRAGTAADGAPVLQIVVELSSPGGPPRFAQGVVAGPAGRFAQVGDQVRVRLDPTGAAVTAVDW